MLNQTGITKVSGTTRKTILIAPELAFALSCKVANTGVDADSDGKKIVKAGTPLAGSMTARDTAFTVASGTDAVGIILHDVDVTGGTQNAQVMTFGFVDISKLDSDVVAKVEAAKSALAGKIQFVQ